MIVRGLRADDLEKLRELNSKHFPNDSFPDFGSLHSVLVVCDSDGSIISAGGVTLIAEGVLVSDMDKSSVKRGKALIQQLTHMGMTCSNLGQPYLMIFESNDDEVWVKALKTYGFESAGKAFYKKVSDGQR